MIAIVNYGLGNIQAFANIYKRLDIAFEIATIPEQIQAADRIVLPGVGSFDWAMNRLNDSGLREALEEAVLGNKRPVIGICVGMQMLARRSEEGVVPGLGWIGAEVRRFADPGLSSPLSLPHMGWNSVGGLRPGGLFADLEQDAQFYFLHSYYVATDRAEDVLAVTDYGCRFAAAVQAGNIYGVQFHPEKSHHWGVRLLQNFAEA